MAKLMFVGGYRRVKEERFGRMLVLGTADFTADVEGGDSWILGTCSFERNVKLRKVVALGTITVNGEAHLKRLVNPGTFISRGNIRIQTLKNKGTFQCDRTFEGDKMNSVGTIRTGADIRLNSFQSRGTFDIRGKLMAAFIDTRICGICRAAEIHGQQVQIRFAGKEARGHHLTTERIHGVKLYIEHTNAKLITGVDISIGPNCTIDLIQYTGKLTVHPSSSVRYSEKS